MADREIVLDAEEQALQREARLAGYRKTIAEGATATMPDLSVDVPDRSLDVGDGESQLPGLIAQDAADDLADGVVQRIVHDTAMVGRTVLVVTDLDVTHASSRARKMMAEVAALTDRLEAASAALVPPPAATPVALPEPVRLDDVDGMRDILMTALPGAVITALKGVEAVAKAAPAVLELLKTDVTVRPSTVSVADEVVVAAVARSLRQRDVAVRIASCTTIPDNEVTQALATLATTRDRVADEVASFTAQHLRGGRAAEVTRQRGVLTGLVTAHDDLLDSGEDRAELQARITALEEWLAAHQPDVDRARAAAETATGLVTRVDGFLHEADTAGSAGLTPIAAAALLHEATRDGSTTDILVLDSTVAVGESVWKEQWRGDQATHIGGLGVSWMLIGADGLLRSSGEHTAARSVTVKLGEPLHWR